MSVSLVLLQLLSFLSLLLSPFDFQLSLTFPRSFFLLLQTLKIPTTDSQEEIIKVWGEEEHEKEKEYEKLRGKDKKNDSERTIK
jgi:hypothetical protein